MAAVSGLEFGRKHGDPIPFPTTDSLHVPAQVVRMMRGLNSLAGVEFGTMVQQLHRPPTAVQQLSIDRLVEVFNEAGSCPCDLALDGCLHDMMKSHHLYDEEPSNLAVYAKEKLKILRSSVQPKPIEKLLPPHLIPVVRNFKSTIERDPMEAVRELEADPKCCPKRPYWDPALQNDPEARADLIASLYKVGVISFRKRIKSSVGLFFVKKKDPSAIRMVVDCRMCNHYHHRPPVTKLGSPSAFSELDLSAEALAEHFGNLDNGAVGFGTEMDVSDCFYQFTLEALGSWFGINMKRSVKFWKQRGVDIHSVYDDDLSGHLKVSEDTEVYPVIGAVPMGWSWALYLANEAIAYLARMTQPEHPLEFREKSPTPQLWECDSIVSTYVDNVSVVGATADGVMNRVACLEEVFRKHEIPVVWSYDSPQRVFETIGLIVDFEKKVIRNKPKRIWKVHLAGKAICRRAKLRTEIVEVWLGHATSLFRLAPHFLSIFFDIYRFVRVNSGKRVQLWPSVRKEIQMAVDLIWLARADLGGGHIHHVDMGDSANNGYALMTRWCTIKQLQTMSKYKEKWRFLPMPFDLQRAISQFADDPSDPTSHEKLRVASDRAGVGINTEYGQWMQQLLEDGSWLKTSPMMTQFKAQRKRRPEIEVGTLVPPVSADIIRPDKFTLLWSRRWRNPDEHINTKEGRVILSSLKRTCRVAALFGGRKVTLSDNLSAIMAFSKGRSSRFGLNRLCRIAASLLGATGVKWSIRHVETKRNIADKPSRRFEGKHSRLHNLSKTENVDVSSSWRHDDAVVYQNGATNHKTANCSSSSSSNCKTHRGVRLCLDQIVPPPGLSVSLENDSGSSPKCGSLRATDSSPLLGLQGTSSSTGSRPHKQTSVRCKKLVVWEIFAGDANLSTTFSKRGHTVARPVDILGGVDVRYRRVQEIILSLIDGHLVDYLHFGTPCSVFSRARRNISNFRKARQKEIDGCILASFTVEACILATQRGVAWTIENPASSRIWEHPDFLLLRALSSTKGVVFDQCRFGTPFKKPTMIMTNKACIRGLELRCNHFRHEVVLCGQTKSGGVWRNRTALASSYPVELCQRWVQCLEQDLWDVKTQLGTDFEQVYKDLLQASSSCKLAKGPGDIQGETHYPKSIILESIVFGQHSKAEAEARRQRRRQSRWFKAKKKALLGNGCDSSTSQKTPSL